MTPNIPTLSIGRLVRFGLVLAACVSPAVCRAESFDGFIAKHCMRCHGAEKAEGDIRFDLLSKDFRSATDSHHWAEALDKVNTGEMPPQKEAQPTRDEIAQFVTDLDARLKEGRAARMAARPAVAHYRLSRKEYQNTVYDLLGVRYDPAKPGELNEDTRWHGFERIGSELSLSPSHVDRYYRAAGVVLERAFQAAGAEPRKVRKTAVDLRYSGSKDAPHWTDSVSNVRFVTYSTPAALNRRWHPTGSVGPARSIADSIKFDFRQAVFDHSAGNRLT